jgi:thiol-disulfide isomerase/thioredoxin
MRLTTALVKIAASMLPTPLVSLRLGWVLLVPAPLMAGQLTVHDVPNATAPCLRLEALDGTPRDLRDYRGKVVLVNFWATWCPPCVAEMPSIQRLDDRLAAEDFEVLAVNVGESPFQVSKFTKLINVRLTMLLDSKGETFKAWGGTIYPTTFVVDGDGRIRYVVHGPLAWDSDDVVETIEELSRSSHSVGK